MSTRKFGGYLIKSGNDAFPLKYIIAESYNTSPHQTTDLDSAQDLTGRLHRHVVECKRSKIEFELRETDDLEQDEIMSWFENHYSDDMEQRLSLTYWNDKTRTYCTDDFYLSDPNFIIQEIDPEVPCIRYQKTRIALIGYGEEI